VVFARIIVYYHQPTLGGVTGGLPPVEGVADSLDEAQGETSPTFCKNQKGGIRNKPVGRSFQRSSPTLHSKRFLPQKKVCFLEKFIYNGNNYI
jgi:hypothetical protein